MDDPLGPAEGCLMGMFFGLLITTVVLVVAFLLLAEKAP